MKLKVGDEVKLMKNYDSCALIKYGMVGKVVTWEYGFPCVDFGVGCLYMIPANNLLKIKKMYYKVIKKNFLFVEGAILRNNVNGYIPVDPVFYTDNVPEDCNEYISSEIVEKCPEFFEQVYKVSRAKRVLYTTKEKARELLKKDYE